MNGAELPIDVSRETEARLWRHLHLLQTWTRRINLVAPSTLGDPWLRHVRDSAQLLPMVPSTARHLTDLGTGGGFPGLTCAIIAAEQRPNLHVTLVESDHRKSAFLAYVVGDLALKNVHLRTARAETLAPAEADVLTARAFAPLPRLLDLAVPHLASGGHLLLLKGERWREEVFEARNDWTFTLTTTPSITNPSAAVLDIGALHRA